MQLEHLRVGQPVSLRADLYGGNVEYHGRVAGLGAGSGSAFRCASRSMQKSLSSTRCALVCRSRRRSTCTTRQDRACRAFLRVCCWNGLKDRETPRRKLPIDSVGLGLLVAWVGALQIMLDTGKDADWFQSPVIVVEAIIAVVGFVAFLIWEIGRKNPLVDLSLFKVRSFTLGTIALVLGYAIFFGSLVLQPLWMQTWLGYTATWAGLVAAPSGVVAVLLSPLVGKYIGKGDPRMFATIAFAAFGISYFMRIIAGSFATSIVTTFWDRHASLHQTQLAESTSLYDPRLQQSLSALHASGFSDLQSISTLTRVLSGQAYLLSAIDFFWISGLISFATIGVVWLARRPAGVPVPAGGE